jgi:hypothetical protein
MLALLGLLDDPQPAIISTPVKTATAIGTRWRAVRKAQAADAVAATSARQVQADRSFATAVAATPIYSKLAEPAAGQVALGRQSRAGLADSPIATQAVAAGECQSRPRDPIRTHRDHPARGPLCRPTVVRAI